MTVVPFPEQRTVCETCRWRKGTYCTFHDEDVPDDYVCTEFLHVSSRLAFRARPQHRVVDVHLLPPLAGVPTMVIPPYPFQDEAISKIVIGDKVYLGFDPGLGKSRTALEAARLRDVKRLLVICPASGRYVWQAETRKWSRYPVTIVKTPADLRGTGVLVVTYGLISQKGSPIADAIANGAAFGMTVLDEAHAVKNPAANRTKAILGKMLPKLGYVLPMSGTPAPNHAGELFPILQAVYPQAVTNNGRLLRQWEFEDRYCRVVMKRFGGGRDIRVIEGSKNLLELRERLQGFMLRVKKEDVLKDLPPIRYDVVPLGVGHVDLPTLPKFSSDEELYQYLNGKMGEHLMRLRHNLGQCKTQPAIEYIDDFLQGLPRGQKVLVFAHHREVIEKLMTGLGEYNPVCITGAANAVQRAEAITTFLQSPTCRVFIGNIQAAGTGLTLVGPKCGCSDVFFVEASFSVGDNVQAAARIHRIGQREAVVARFLTAHGTIDDAIQGILARKARDFASLFDGETQ